MIERIDAAALRELAGAWHLTLDGAEVDGLGTVAEDLISIMDPLLDDADAPARPVAATREVGERPARDADPLNAIVRRINVRADVPGDALAGLRVAMKDSIAIAGVPLTLGSSVMDGFIPNVDAVVTDRLLRAGAELVAVTNMDNFAFSGGGDTSAYGPTLNPFDSARTAAGSSGGSAAILRYDDVDAALGTDQGGSVRVPASWCGILGLKPTHSLVPYTGIAGIDATFDHVGPMTRTVDDMARMLEVLAGPDASDPRQTAAVVGPSFTDAVSAAGHDLSGVRIGVVPEGSGEAVGAQPEVVEALAGVVTRLEALGATIVETPVPEHETAAPIAFAGFVEGMTALLTAGGNGHHWRGRYWPEMADRLAQVLRDQPNQLSEQIKVVLMVGLHLRRLHGGGVYGRAQNRRPRLIAAYDRALESADCLLMPSTPGLPHLVDDSLSLHEHIMRGWAVLANTSPTDMTGHPSLSMPAAEANGLPVGAMIIGRHFGDARLLTIAAVYERAYGWSPTAPRA